MKNELKGSELSAEDRVAVVDRFRTLLRPAFMREYLTTEVERLVAGCERRVGGCRALRVDDADLPDLLLDLHGAEILREREMRLALVSCLPVAMVKELLRAGNHEPSRNKYDAIDQIARRKWTPGKNWAVRFCSIMGLPLSLAGQPDGGGEAAVEELNPYVPLPPLHDFQEELRDELLDLIAAHRKGRRGLLSLPTGAGKTRTCVDALVIALREGTLRSGHVLWLAQSEELCEQAVQAFREVWTQHSVRAAGRDCPDGPTMALPLYRLWGSRAVPEDMGGRSIVVASIQKLNRLCEHEESAFQEFLERVQVVVADEAHHAIAPSYTEVFNQLGFRRRSGDRALIGLTATPYRGNEEETRRLITRFSSNLVAPPWPNAVAELRERGILAKTRIDRVETKRSFRLDASELAQYKKFQDIPENTLRRIGSDIERNTLILQTLAEIPQDTPVLFFACSVTHARAIALLLRRAGRTAVAVTGETPRALRRTWIQQFKAGEIQFLCNYGILTTGFDAPRVEVVVIGRPTESVLLYEQMVGRGMRGPLNGGTESCRVVDLVDIFPQFGEQMSYARYRTMWQEYANRKSV